MKYTIKKSKEVRFSTFQKFEIAQKKQRNVKGGNWEDRIISDEVMSPQSS